MNAEKTLDRCLRSFRNQNYPLKQVVIIDGASTDSTIQIAHSWLTEGDVILSEPDSGIYDAWNKAIPLCRGEWISFLGADDWLPNPNTYDDIARTLESLSEDVEIVYGNVSVLNSRGETLLTLGKPWEVVSGRHRAGGTLPHPGSLHRASVFERVGKFDPRFRIAGDYEFQLRALKNRQPFYLPDTTTAFHALGGISGNEDMEIAAIREVIRARRLHKLWLPSRKLVIDFAYSALRRGMRASLGTNRTVKILDWGRRLLGRPDYWAKN